jgi:hypothetical protein
MPPVWQNAVKLYSSMFGESPPQNFNINISATATNYKYIAGAAETLTKLGINVPGIFFYASANMDEYYKNDEEPQREQERWRGLAAALVEAARRTTGKKLVLEFEHGLGPKRSAKSSLNIVRVVDEITDYAKMSEHQCGFRCLKRHTSQAPSSTTKPKPPWNQSATPTSEAPRYCSTETR